MPTTSESKRLFWSFAASALLNTAFLGLIGWLWVPRPTPPSEPPARTMRVAVWTPPPDIPPPVVKPVVTPPPLKPTPPKSTPKPVVRQVIPPKPQPMPKPRVLPRKATLAAPSRRPTHTANPRPAPSGGSSGGRPSTAPILSQAPPQTAAPPQPARPAPANPAPVQLARSNPNGQIAMPKLTPGDAPLAAPSLPPAPPSGGGGGTGAGQGNGHGNGSGQGQGTGTGNGTGNGRGSGGGPFGLGTGSGEGPRHIVYVLDISGSMTSRIDRARQELRDSLRSLQPNESFDIVTFSDRVRAFDNQLDPATPAMVRRADYFLSTIQVDGGTDLESALEQALSMPGVNVVFVMTDGVPTQYRQQPIKEDFNRRFVERFARHVRNLNVNGARIYTVGLVGRNPDGSDQSFEAAGLLRRLSDDSGGVSKIITLGVAMP